MCERAVERLHQVELVAGPQRRAGLPDAREIRRQRVIAPGRRCLDDVVSELVEQQRAGAGRLRTGGLDRPLERRLDGDRDT